jgi:cyclophilin family peptidyl-prolyl cis-trans isomerase
MKCKPVLVAMMGLLMTSAAAADGPLAQIVTTLGTITITLDRVHAPVSVDNFIRYAKEGHFDGTAVYRVVPGYVIQAGSYETGGNYRAVHEPIPLESGVSNLRGSVAMAREGDVPASATAEFFIDLDDNNASALDPKPGDAPGQTGYAVFGRVTAGMDVVDKIASVPLGGGKGPFPDNEPVTAVTIEKVTIADAPTP